MTSIPAQPNAAVHKVNHIAVVVSDVEAALKFWRDALGLPLERTEHNAAEAVTIAFLPVGESEIELLAPTTPDSGIAKYLAKTGGGLHHICLEVADIEASMAQLTAHGIELINTEPRTRPDGIRYAFVHPKSAGGVMVELYQLPVKQIHEV
jgi:methylmalonyl-CoA/ethylmalonyl-CoA epimerase